MPPGSYAWHFASVSADAASKLTPYFASDAARPSVLSNSLWCARHSGMMRLAKLAGIDRPRIESSTHKIPSNIPAGSTRVTCSLEMAHALLEAFGQQAMHAEERKDTALFMASGKAIVALLAAIDEYHRPRGRRARRRRRTEMATSSGRKWPNDSFRLVRLF